MGVCYTYLLYDDFDWEYSDKSKDQVIQDIKKDLPVATILTQWYQYLVIDIDKNWPLGDNAQSLHKYCNVAWCYTDMSPYHMERVEFKPSPKEQVVIENDNRLKDVREEAYKDWTTRYHNQEISSNNELTNS